MVCISVPKATTVTATVNNYSNTCKHFKIPAMFEHVVTMTRTVIVREQLWHSVEHISVPITLTVTATVNSHLNMLILQNNSHVQNCNYVLLLQIQGGGGHNCNDAITCDRAQ